MKKEHRTNRRYSAEFKIRVILDMRNNHLGYNETVYITYSVSINPRLRKTTPMKILAYTGNQLFTFSACSLWNRMAI